MQQFEFDTQLSIGKRGEDAFHARFPYLERLDGREGDFAFAGSGRKIEVKTESRDMDETPNFFIEIESRAGHPGGPFQAKAHGCEYFSIFFVKNKKSFWFRTDDLCTHLTTHEYPLISVDNREWTTKGILVPREALEHLVLAEE